MYTHELHHIPYIYICVCDVEQPLLLFVKYSQIALLPPPLSRLAGKQTTTSQLPQAQRIQTQKTKEKHILKLNHISIHIGGWCTLQLAQWRTHNWNYLFFLFLNMALLIHDEYLQYNLYFENIFEIFFDMSGSKCSTNKFGKVLKRNTNNTGIKRSFSKLCES